MHPGEGARRVWSVVAGGGRGGASGTRFIKSVHLDVLHSRIARGALATDAVDTMTRVSCLELSVTGE